MPVPVEEIRVRIPKKSMIFLAYGVVCLLIAYLGRNRPMGFWGYFFASVFLSPLIGILLLAAAGRNRARPSDED